MYCKNCNNEMSNTDLKCPHCGYEVKEISNGIKVLLSIVSVIPLIGQILTLIFSIIYMKSNNTDSKKFGKALMIATIIMFVLMLICCGVYLILVFSFIDTLPEFQNGL